MARKFLYIVAGAVVLLLALLLAMRFWADDLTEMAFVPTTEFNPQPSLAADAYAGFDMWVSRPGLGEGDPSGWLPEGVEREAESLGASVFFVHPTSFFDNARWNAPLDDAESRKLVSRWIKDMASPFNRSADLWAPRYRQATLGAFVTGAPQADKAIALAYGDVGKAFDVFVETVARDRPIILAGHSQGAFHLSRLIRDRVKGTALQDRIVAAYLVGWPVSLAHDIPQLGLPPCTAPDQHGCVISWLSFAEPAEHKSVLENYAERGWLDGEKSDGRPFLCNNPLSGMTSGAASASDNLGTLRFDAKAGKSSLAKGMIPARCGEDGFLYIGPPPDLGKWVLPGNNYHVYDIPMFWMNLREDVSRRVTAWQEAH